ncbi:MAG: antitoxin family protein, partial [Flavisolibacter sp.]|nr:antitoxin family protein [Flavisolibacter sp.]
MKTDYTMFTNFGISFHQSQISFVTLINNTIIMNQRLRAIYQNGTFIPLEPFDLPEDSEVELTV